MDVTTRKATAPDLPFLGAIDSHISPSTLAELVERGCVMVGEIDQVPVGLLRWSLFWDQVPFMNLLWVVPERRAQGVGTALVGAWEKVQVAAGHQMVLTSCVSAEPAQHFYRGLGYVDAGALFLPDEPAELILRRSLVD